jgi:hypothetical protein
MIATTTKGAEMETTNYTQQDETALISNALRGGISRLTPYEWPSTMTMGGPGETEASFTVEGEHHTYKVTVERWNG